MNNALNSTLGSALQGSEEGEAKRSVGRWSAAEVCAWLDSRPLGAQRSLLQQAAYSHAISGKALLRLTDESLERMGVASGSLRQELLHEVLCLRLQQEMEDLLDITDNEIWHLPDSEGMNLRADRR